MERRKDTQIIVFVMEVQIHHVLINVKSPIKVVKKWSENVDWAEPRFKFPKVTNIVSPDQVQI